MIFPWKLSTFLEFDVVVCGGVTSSTVLTFSVVSDESWAKIHRSSCKYGFSLVNGLKTTHSSIYIYMYE